MNLKLGSRLWWGLPVLLVLLMTGGLLTIKQYPGLPTPPEFIMWALPSIRFSRDIASMLTVGALITGGLLLSPQSARVRKWAAGWSGIWLASLLALLVCTISEVSALPAQQVLAPSIWMPFLTDSVVGRVFLFQGIGILIVLTSCFIRNTPLTRWCVIAIGVAASASPAFLGHGGFSSTHAVLTISLGIHIGAASIWVGCLAVTVAYLRIEPTRASALLPRFSLLALWSVILVAEAGLLNASLRVGSASLFVGTLYGSLVIAKAVLLGWLIWMGWLQRSRVVKRIAQQPLAIALLARFAAVEFAIMGLAIAIAIVLSRIGFEGFGSGDGSFTPLAILSIGLALPLLISVAWTQTQPWPILIRLRAYPEIASVALLVVIAEVAGLGILNPIFGVELGVMISTGLLIGFGWLWCVAINGPRRMNGIAVMMIGYPCTIVFVTRASSSGSSAQINLLSILVAEAILIAMARWRTPGEMQIAEEMLHA